MLGSGTTVKSIALGRSLYSGKTESAIALDIPFSRKPFLVFGENALGNRFSIAGALSPGKKGLVFPLGQWPPGKDGRAPQGPL